MHSTIGRRRLRVVLALPPAPGCREGVVRLCLGHLNETWKTRHK